MRLVSASLWCALVAAPVAAQAPEPAGVLGATMATSATPTTSVPLTALVPAKKIVTAPEPGTLLLVGTGLVGFAITLRHRRRTAK